MTVRELIEKLQEFDKDRRVRLVIANVELWDINDYIDEKIMLQIFQRMLMDILSWKYGIIIFLRLRGRGIDLITQPNKVRRHKHRQPHQ